MTEQEPQIHHESYGAITLTHQHGPPRTLFGSPFQHADVIRLEIHTASILRSLHEDHVMTKDHILTGHLSQAQLANALFSLSAGPPTPITIQFLRGDQRQRRDPPPRDGSTLFDPEIIEFIDTLVSQCDDLIESTKGTARRKAQGIREALKNNIPFIAEQMRNTHQRTVEDAKHEIDAFIKNRLTQTGLDAVIQRHDTLSLPTYPPTTGEDTPTP